jgi:hypothetical protein
VADGGGEGGRVEAVTGAVGDPYQALEARVAGDDGKEVLDLVGLSHQAKAVVDPAR